MNLKVKLLFMPADPKVFMKGTNSYDIGQYIRDLVGY